MNVRVVRPEKPKVEIVRGGVYSINHNCKETTPSYRTLVHRNRTNEYFMVDPETGDVTSAYTGTEALKDDITNDVYRYVPNAELVVEDD